VIFDSGANLEIVHNGADTGFARSSGRSPFSTLPLFVLFRRENLDVRVFRETRIERTDRHVVDAHVRIRRRDRFVAEIDRVRIVIGVVQRVVLLPI
jgi:hypothetical protein